MKKDELVISEWSEKHLVVPRDGWVIADLVEPGNEPTSGGIILSHSEQPDAYTILSAHKGLSEYVGWDVIVSPNENNVLNIIQVTIDSAGKQVYLIRESAIVAYYAKRLKK